MSDENTTPPEDEKQPTDGPIQLTSVVNDKIEYDGDAIDAFISTVFHSPLDADEEILLWRCPRNIPGYPEQSEELFFNRLEVSHSPMALYYGMSTCSRDPADNNLYNRGALFKRMHVVVLDDIGTKIDRDLLKGIEPTYIIESSAGNEQWGFVLETPISDFELAKALLQIVYDTGLTDTGGRMPTKLVRLPGGVNGKLTNEKRLFPVELLKTNGPLWTPEKLLEAFDAGVAWTEVVEDLPGVTARRRSRSGITVWSPVHIEAPTLDGIVDPVLEWLYVTNVVIQETDNWFTIQCPNSAEHTTGETTAFYSPVGHGDTLYEHQRGFKCFHDACSAYSTVDFLRHVAANNGPEVGVFDHAAELLAHWAYDASCANVVNMDASEKIQRVPFSTFKDLKPKVATVYMSDGKAKRIPITQLWRNSPQRVTIWGTTFDPSTEASLVKRGKELYLNRYLLPNWGAGAFDQDHVDTFLEFIEYLLPDPDDSSYFLDWLAAKVQNGAFRGPGILMIATQFGTGRTTLGDMIATLFGQHNVARMQFSELIGDRTFNEWQQHPIIISDETLDMGSDSVVATFYRAYERIKGLVDTRPTNYTVNVKYGGKFEDISYSSYLFYSNHENAMALPEGDRRIRVMRNVMNRATPDYFTRLNKWLDEKSWAAHVWRWLQVREIDPIAMLAPVEEHGAKTALTESVQSVVDLAIADIISKLHVSVHTICTKDLSMFLIDRRHQLGLEHHAQADQVISRAIKRVTSALPITCVVKHDGKSKRSRAINARSSTAPECINLPSRHIDDVKIKVRADLTATDWDMMKDSFAEFISTHE